MDQINRSPKTAADTAPVGLLGRLWTFAIDVPADLNAEDSRLLSVFRISVPVAALVHLGFVALFLVLGQTILAIYNIFSLALLGAAAWTAYRYGLRATNFIALALMVEIPLHALLTTLFLGLDTLFICYVVTLMMGTGFIHIYTLGTRIILAAFCAATMVATAALGFLVEPLQPEGAAVTAALAIQSVVGTAAVAFLMASTFAMAAERTEARARAEHQRAEELLRNILPAEIAERLKTSPAVIADEHPEATILFADIVGFTERSARLTPTELVDRLNRVFSAFDRLATKHGVEKIKTIGDAYMVVAGLPQHRDDHAEVIVRMAQDMLLALQEVNKDLNEPIRVRIGVNTGPVVAGVIGQTKFAYDLWGDTVNLASRLEEIAEPGQVRMGEKTRAALGDAFACADQGEAEIKGKGRVRTWALAAE